MLRWQQAHPQAPLLLLPRPPQLMRPVSGACKVWGRPQYTRSGGWNSVLMSSRSPRTHIFTCAYLHVLCESTTYDTVLFVYINVLFPWYCKVCVPCVLVILQFALRQKTEVCSIRRSLKTCFCQLQETSAPPTTTSIPQTHDRRRRGANSQDAPKTNTLPAAQKETYEDCTSEKRKKRLLWNTFNDPW